MPAAVMRGKFPWIADCFQIQFVDVAADDDAP
jgi:hypothetical protein